MKRFVFALVLVFVIINASCSSYDDSTPYTTKVVSHYINATSFPELVQSSDIVVVAKVVNRKEESFNLARDPRDHSHPAADILQPAVVYELQVEHYLKGKGESTLYLVQAERTILPGENDKTQVAVGSRAPKPLQVNTRYVLFLRRLEMPYPDVPSGEWVAGVVEPYRFRLEGGMARVESPWPPAEMYFPPMPEKILFARVREMTGR